MDYVLIKYKGFWIFSKFFEREKSDFRPQESDFSVFLFYIQIRDYFLQLKEVLHILKGSFILQRIMIETVKNEGGDV